MEEPQQQNRTFPLYVGTRNGNRQPRRGQKDVGPLAVFVSFALQTMHT